MTVSWIAALVTFATWAVLRNFAKKVDENLACNLIGWWSYLAGGMMSLLLLGVAGVELTIPKAIALSMVGAIANGVATLLLLSLVLGDEDEFEEEEW